MDPMGYGDSNLQVLVGSPVGLEIVQRERETRDFNGLKKSSPPAGNALTLKK